MLARRHLVVLATLYLAGSTLSGASFTMGDVFVSLRNGTVREYTPTGSLVQTLTTDRTGELTGSAFDSNGNFYQTAGFTGGDVVWFDSTGNYMGTFGSGYSGHPESILFDASKAVWVGQADSTAIVHLSSTGALIDSFTLQIEDRGTDWIDLASDQKTMHYTSEGPSVLRYDTSTSTQQTPFGAGGGTQYALRLLPGGGALVANTNNVLRYDSSGSVVQTYLPGSTLLFALNLDPDGKSFWTAEYLSGRVYQIDIATGAITQQWETGAGISGLSVFGEITVSQPPGIPEPATWVLLAGGLIAIGFRRRRA